MRMFRFPALRRELAVVTGTYLLGCHRYTGDFVMNQRHGNGTVVFKNGDTCTTEWVSNVRHGFARCEYNTRYVHEGHRQTCSGAG